MGAGSGFALKFLQWFNRGVQFCCSALILAIFSYFLATLHNHNLEIAPWIRAVEGISGAAVLYTAVGLLLLCCLAGFALTSFIAIALDVAFCAAFIYVAAANRGGAGSCTGVVDTPFGSGDANTDVGDNGNAGFTNLGSYRSACRLETACFAVALVAIFFFIFSAVTEFWLARHHRKEKAFGPSPGNGYTSGSAKKGSFFSRMRSRRLARSGTKSTNANVLPEHTHPDAVRTSYATETTAVPPQDELNMHSYKEPEHPYSGHGLTNEHHHSGHGIAHNEPVSPITPGTAHYPTGNYHYNDGVYDTRRV